MRGAVEDAVAEAGGSVRGPVAMLGHVRTWGWLFNPLTLYYCFDPSGRTVEWTVLEVSNTPWHERCSYVVGPPGEHCFAKAMHVSPFLPAQGVYTLRYSAPEEEIRVSLDVAAPPPPRTVWSVARAEPRQDPAPVGRSHGAATSAARSRRLGPSALGPPAHDGAGLGWHLRPSTATGCPRRPDPPTPRSTRPRVPTRGRAIRGCDQEASGCPR